MEGVNSSRRKMARNVTDATEDARLIGFNDDGEACMWFGGYTFLVYDVARDWQQVRDFTCGDMSDHQNEEKARERIEQEGFRVI